MDNWQRARVSFQVEKEPVDFSIVHNINPNDGMGSIEDALDNWLARTNEYTAKSLVNYINSKKVHQAYTYEQFENITHIKMGKILIIGQALPAVKQTVPYDTTMLYDWLSELGISVDQAQEMFEFDAVYGSFTGFDANGGHLKPTQQQMDEHWKNVLETKVQLADKVWLLGNVARDYIASKPKTWSCATVFLNTIHPSKRNADRYYKNKHVILHDIKQFLHAI